MNDHEQNYLAEAMRLVNGLRDIIGNERLTRTDIPDDWEWLIERLVTLHALHLEVEQCEGGQPMTPADERDFERRFAGDIIEWLKGQGYRPQDCIIPMALALTALIMGHTREGDLESCQEGLRRLANLMQEYAKAEYERDENNERPH